MIRAGANFKWSIQATTNLTARLSIDELTLLRRSGLHQICQGIETASPTVMKLMNKDFQVLGDIYQSTERCIKAGVIPSFNIIFGFPGEGPKERRETVNFMMDICRKFPGAEFWTNIFTPYPGSPIFQQAAKLGIEVPKTLEGWADYFPRYTVLPWLKGSDHQRVQTMRDYLRIAFRSRAHRDDRPWTICQGGAAPHGVPSARALELRFLQFPGRAVDQSSVEEHREIAQAERGCEKAAAGNCAEYVTRRSSPGELPKSLPFDDRSLAPSYRLRRWLRNLT